MKFCAYNKKRSKNIFKSYCEIEQKVIAGQSLKKPKPQQVFQVLISGHIEQEG